MNILTRVFAMMFKPKQKMIDLSLNVVIFIVTEDMNYNLLFILIKYLKIMCSLLLEKYCIIIGISENIAIGYNMKEEWQLIIGYILV